MSNVRYNVYDRPQLGEAPSVFSMFLRCSSHRAGTIADRSQSFGRNFTQFGTLVYI